MGSRTPDGDGIGPLKGILEDIRGRLRELEQPTGTATRSLVSEVKAALANITITVTNAIESLSYTKEEIDDRVANPPNGSAVTGDITATGNISAAGGFTAQGDVTGANGIFPAGVRSTGAYSYVAGSNRFTMWIDPSGQMGIAPSSRRFKTDIETWEIDIAQLLQLRGVMFRYNPQMFPDQWMDPDAPKEIGFIAEELLELGFPMFVVFDADGEPSGIAYERMVVALLVLAQCEHDQNQAEHAEFDRRLTALEG